MTERVDGGDGGGRGGREDPATLVVLAAPSLGILDNWLPVMAAARERYPDWRITVVVPERGTLREVRVDDTVVGLVDELCDDVIVPAADGGWLRFAGLAEARAATDAERRGERALAALAAAAWRLRRRRLDVVPRALRPALRPLRPRSLRGAATSLRSAIGPSPRLCYDVYVHLKPSTRPVLAALGDAPRFSLHHGIDVIVRPSSAAVPTDAPRLERRVYLHADVERTVYATAHGVPDAAMRVVGVPRHAPWWVDRVVAASEARHTVPWDDAVLVVSRPAGSSYLPTDRKEAALRALHRVVVGELGLRLVIKPHPKEGDDGTVARALPAAEEGVTWMRSGAHPFHLARRSVAAVAFHSGVVVDLVMLGTPVVELIDVRGLPRHDVPDAVRDARGRPMFSAFRQRGMVLPADDADDLRLQLRRCRDDRDAVVAELRSAVTAVFPPVPGAIAGIVADLADPDAA